jgi:intracellular septation protein
MKFLFDYLPIIVFFIAYKFGNIYLATALTMITTVLQISLFWLIHRRVEKFHLITMAFVVILGSFTLLLHNPIFIQWKPTVVYWLFSAVLMGSQWFTHKNIIHRMLDEKITLPLKIWRRVNTSWALFFVFLGGLNLYVVYHFSTAAWVNFKLFGTLGLLILFILIQGGYIAKHSAKHESQK